MSAAVRPLCPRVDDVYLYALQTLPEREIAGVEAHLENCERCRSEVETLGRVLDSFVDWPRDVLRPAKALWDRIADRISAESSAPPPRRPKRDWREPDWNEVSPGIFTKLLATDHENHRVSMLVRLAPGVAYPPHTHAGVEELHLLGGVLVVNDKTLYPGDYICGEAGSADSLVWTEKGCTCVLITSTRDELG
jgi:anti-sigma factor ChrR (cupin superfamily)